MSSDTKHIELVTLKIGLAETDEELESILLKFMAPILQILQTTDGGVRTKVLSLLTHINKRLKARESIQLPVEALLHQFNDESMNSFVTNFSVIYMKTGFKRLDADKKLQLLPLLFISLKGKLKNQQNHLLRLIAENLTLVAFANATTRPFFEEFNFQDNKEQLDVLLDYFLDVLIMPYSSSLNEAIGSASTSDDILTPGLSKNSIRRLLGDQVEDYWSFDKVEQIKLSILNFIKLDFVDASLTVPHLVVASSDTRFSVATNSDQQIRNSLGTIDWSDEKMTMALYRIYLGHAADLALKPGPEDKVQPANIRIKMKLMQYLLRCPAATEMFPHHIQVVYDGLFAASNVKLKTFALQFMHYIFDNAGIDKLKKQAPMLLNAAIKVVREKTEDSSRIQSLAYTSITKLAARLPHLFAEKFELLQQFIDSLAIEESTDVKQSIMEATTSMIPAFSDLSEEKITAFRPLVDKSMSNADHYIRMVGVRYAANIFGEADVKSRYMLLLSTADVKEEVAAEASSFIRTGLKSGKMPPFELMLDYISGRAEERIHSRYAYSIGVQSLAFHPVAFKAIIKFVYVCFLKKCNAVLRHDEDEDFNNNHQQLEFDLSAVVNFVKSMLASDREKACMLMNKLMRLMVDYSALVQDPFVLNLMLKTTGATCYLISIEQLFENRNPRSKSMSKDKCMEWAESLAYHNRDETSYVGAEFFALIFSHDQPSPEKYVALLRKLEENLSSKTYDEQHGGILLLAYLLGDYLSWSHHSSATEDSDLKTFTSGLLIQLGEIANISSDQNLVAAACFAIGEIARKSPLPLPDGTATKLDILGGEVIFTAPATKLDFVLLLRNRLRGKFTHRVRQRAATALGKIPVGESPFVHADLVRQALFDTSKMKDTDSKHFVIGEALINCALGPQSLESLNKWTGKPIHMVALLENSKTQDEDAGMDVDLEDPKGMEELLDKILNIYVEHRIPSARQASCIWLTKILTSVECTRLKTISQHLIGIQNAFTALILESDELTQDLASKGLCLVYELGDQTIKDLLVSDLVESLTGNAPGTSQTVRILGDESQKFYRDIKARRTKDKKVEGPALLLYKEMCNLASDLNRPELVYKFLYLQNHRAVGNTSGKSDDPTSVKVYSSDQKKSGVDYNSVVESTREQLKPLHKQIIPRLYRNTFDPQPNVRTAMTSIWNVICPEPNKAISAFLPEIVQELLTGLTHMLWRNRQASCLAFMDLFRLGITIQMHSNESGRTVAVKGNPIIDSLAEIWSTAIRVQDDMKESVRESATKLCSSLKKVLLKLIDPHQSSQMKENILTDVINVLLKEGMLSKVKESRAASLDTLVEVSKLSGELIKPCISVLVVSLLEALSEVESPQINYLRNRSEHNTQDKLDWIRAEFVKSTPMMETAVRCLKHYDSKVLDDLVPALAELTKRGVGVPTKAGCAHFACQLVTICGQDLTPYAGKLLKVFVSGLRDPSLAIRKVNSSAVGNLSRVAKDASVSTSIKKFKEWYLKEDDATSRHASASAIYAIARHSPDTMQHHLAEVMPLAFFAMHGKVVTDENTNKTSNSSNADNVTKNDDQSFDMSPKEMFEAVWNEFTPGSETAVRIYLAEIVTLASDSLNSQNWESKAQAAKTMSSVAMYQSSNAIQLTHLNRLIEALVGGLRGRHWVGKNYLLSALKDLLKHHGGDLDKKTVEKVLDSLLAESGRSKNISYRCEALVCYGTAAAALKLDKLQPLWEATLKLINPEKRDSDSEDEVEDSKSRKSAKEEICRSIFPVADNMWSAADARVREEHGAAFLSLVVDAYVNGIYQTRVICLSSIVRFLESILSVTEKSGNAKTEAVAVGQLSHFSYIHSKLFQVLLQALGDMKYSQLRQKGAAVVTLLCRLSKAGLPFAESEELEKLCDVLRQQVTVCSDLTCTADNMEALEYMRNALGNIEQVLKS